MLMPAKKEDNNESLDLDLSRSTSFVTEDDKRDEVKEVQKMSQKDTNFVVFWQFLVTLMLLITAVGVTLPDYGPLSIERAGRGLRDSSE